MKTIIETLAMDIRNGDHAAHINLLLWWTGIVWA